MRNNIGYVYDKSGYFWNITYTPKQLKKMENAKDPDISYIRHNLYLEKIYSEKYKIIFMNTENPYFRRYSRSEAERYGFNSVCESKLHKACKLGIANAKRIRIKINRKNYILSKDWSDTETTYQLLGNMYETDCEFAISNIDDELKSLLGGDVLYLEVHHTSKVKPDKIKAYNICGMNVLEFDIQTKYLPYDIRNEKVDEEKMIDFFSKYYEDVEKHYIDAILYPPIVSNISWEGGRTKVYDCIANSEIEIIIYKDKFSEEKRYNILFVCGNTTYTQRAYNGKRIVDFGDAKHIATYLIEMHLQGIISIDFR